MPWRTLGGRGNFLALAATLFRKISYEAAVEAAKERGKPQGEVWSWAGDRWADDQGAERKASRMKKTTIPGSRGELAEFHAREKASHDLPGKDIVRTAYFFCIWHSSFKILYFTNEGALVSIQIKHGFSRFKAFLVFFGSSFKERV